ncbi:MAG: hypothetical protein GY812_09420 [Actinomycetia bacterium]|nr:hypothetical protein [Actinomycetes bacterium]
MNASRINRKQVGIRSERRSVAPAPVRPGMFVRFALASVVVLAAGAVASTAASAAPAGDGWDDDVADRLGSVPAKTTPPLITIPPLPDVSDLLPELEHTPSAPGAPQPAMPPLKDPVGDQAGPDSCDDCWDPSEPDVPEDRHRIVAEESYDEDYEGPYPYGCGPDELVACPERERQVPNDDHRDCEDFEVFAAGICDEPGESTTTVVTDTTAPSTAPSTTTTVYDLEEIEVQVAEESEVRTGKDDNLAFTGGNSLLSLVGAGVLAVGVLIAGLSVAARSRDEATGEHQGRV